MLKQIFWTICIFFLCIFDQQLGSQGGEVQVICPALVFTVIGIMILSHYKFRSFLKIPYAIWTVISVIAAPIAVMWGQANVVYIKQWYVMVFNVILYGYLAIRTIIAIFREKERPNMNPWLIGIFGLLILLVGISRNDNKWMIQYLLAFLLFYLTAFSQEEYSHLIKAFQNGIILAFIILQGMAFVFRPFDTPRYMGMYANENINALFYQSVYCAFLSKFCIMEGNIGKQSEHSENSLFQNISIIKWIYFSLACTMWSFIAFTMCRSAMLGMAAVTFFGFIYCMKQRKSWWPLHGLRYLICMAALIVLCFPVAYSAVRYLPSLFNHPKWFNEGYSENRVLPGDSWDSPKYTHWKDIIDGNLNRVLNISTKKSSRNSELIEENLVIHPVLKNIGGELASTDASHLTRILASAGNDSSHSSSETPNDSSDEESTALLESKDSTSHRLYIYQHYLKSLNMRGHLESENGVQVTETYHAPHAHNILLQYLFNYGIPAGILFIGLLLATGMKLLWNTFGKQKERDSITALILFSASLIFSITEIIWRNGYFAHGLLYFMMFFAWYTPKECDMLQNMPLTATDTNNSNSELLLEE